MSENTGWDDITPTVADTAAAPIDEPAGEPAAKARPRRGAARRNPARRNPSRRSGAKITSTMVESVLATHEKVGASTSEVRAAAAAALGVTNEQTALTAALLTSTSEPSSVSDLDTVNRASGDKVEALVELIDMGSKRIHAVYDVLRGLTGRTADSLPPSDAKAARTVIDEMEKVDVDLALNDLRSLLGR